jgi:hypothetical protein
LAVIDYINIDFLHEDDKKQLEDKTNFLSKETKKSIGSIRFAQNCIIINKKIEADYKYNNIKYHFYDRV